jgi:hypothetical protein
MFIMLSGAGKSSMRANTVETIHDETGGDKRGPP